MSYSAAFYAANRERILAAGRAWQKANPERCRAKTAAWTKTHPETAKIWRKANADRIHVRVRAWQKENPENIAANGHRRRARKIGNGGTYTAAQWRAKLALHGHRCFYCGADGKLTVDHDRPLARGGTNTIGNLLPACMPCNARKGTRTAVEYTKAT